MSKELSDHKRVDVVDVVRHGEKLILPELMTVPQGIEALERFERYQTEEVSTQRTFDVFPWDGANAMIEVLRARFGFVTMEPIETMFGTIKPKQITIKTGVNETKKIPWGHVALPNNQGVLETGMTEHKGRAVFALQATTTHAHETLIESLFDDIEQYLRENSIYMGKAIKIRFRNDTGKKLAMPEPEFLDTKGLSRESLVYSDEVQDFIETSLFTPIERVDEMLELGIPVKRGVLLGGKYGTGKTLAASVAAALAEQNGVTYLYVPRADELSDALQFAQQYQRKACVIFCEDIDRAVNGERSVQMDDILNILDGIESKESRIITVLTTNHLENINRAMLRPGRLDAVVNVTPPDAKAAEKLLRLYGKDALADDIDLSAAGKELDGQIPAVIAEVMQRAKLAELRLTPRGQKMGAISAAAVLSAAKAMRSQVQLLEPVEAEKAEPSLTEYLTTAVTGALNGTKEAVADTQRQVRAIHDCVV